MNNSASGPTRAQPESFRARAVGFSLTVRDFPKSLAWYLDVLGCTKERDYERDGRVFGARLVAGDVEFSLNQDDGKKGADRVLGQGFSLMFTTAQRVDDVAARIKAAGGTLDSEPADMPWGARIFRLTDPDGYKLVISSERS